MSKEERISNKITNKKLDNNKLTDGKSITKKSSNGKSSDKKLGAVPDDIDVKGLSKVLSKQIDTELWEKKYVGTKDVLKLVGMGAFVVASLAMPGLPKALKPFVKNPHDLFSDKPEPWRRFNIPHLKQTLKRLEKQKLVEISEKDGQQVVEITAEGSRKILKFSLDTLEIKKPKHWDGTWRLVSYDVPEKFKGLRQVIKEYLEAWGFYEIHESLYLQAYPCEKEVEWLRAYLGAGEYLRIFKVVEIENSAALRDFFDV